MLSSDVVDLDAYTSQRITVYGTLVPGYESGQVEGGPPLVYVTAVVPEIPAETLFFDFFSDLSVYKPAFL